MSSHGSRGAIGDPRGAIELLVRELLVAPEDLRNQGARFRDRAGQPSAMEHRSLASSSRRATAQVPPA
jgi:hypothetical protein